MEPNFELAVDLLKRGEPVVFPTETVYGLGAPIFNEAALLKIFAIKNRPSDNPLIVHVSSIEQALEISHSQPPAFMTLANRFWPGPLTLILKRQGNVPSIVSAGHPTIAIRMPSHQIALELIRRVGQPLAAPSANLSGRPSPTRASDAAEDLAGRVELILDGGECHFGVESTVLSLVTPTPLLLRPGAISQEELEEALQSPISLPTSNDPIHSPGMKYRHYAPRAEVRLIFSRDELSSPFILSPDPKMGEHLLTEKTLYRELREADRQNVSLIEIDCSPAILKNPVLMNRLLKIAKD